MTVSVPSPPQPQELPAGEEGFCFLLFHHHRDYRG